MAALDLPMAKQDEGSPGPDPTTVGQPTQAVTTAPTPAPAAPTPAPTSTPAPAQQQQAVPTQAADAGSKGGQATQSTPDQQGQSAQPTQGIKPVAQSEPTPDKSAGSERPILDPRPLKLLEQTDPKKFDLVKSIATETGISPERLAAHWYHETGFSMDGNLANKDGDGSMGPVQLQPSTAKQFNDGGRLDMSNPVDNLRIGARYMRYLDDKLGKDTFASVAGYQGGEGSVADAAAHPDMAMRNHPHMMQYGKGFFPGFDVGAKDLTGPSNLTFHGAVNAANQNGPQGFLQYVTSNAPDGMTMTDAWQHAEGSLVQAMLAKGDIEGAQHARDFVMQQAHIGTTQSLMEAHARITAGDAVGAAQALARSHAFFPDGTMGRFGVDSQGNVYGERLDEHNPSRVLQTYKIDAQGIAGMIARVQNPKDFLNTLLEQQKVAVSARHQELLGQHYLDLAENNRVRAEAADERNKTNIARLNETSAHNIETERLTEELRKTQDKRAGEQTQLHGEVDKEVTNLFGPDADNKTPAATRGSMAQKYKIARIDGGADPVNAENMARGLSAGTLQLLRGKDGSAAVVGKDGKPVSYLPKAAADKLLPPEQPAAAPQVGKPGQAVNTGTPVGAGAGSSYAQGAGIGQNLTGTTQSAAVP